MSVGKRLKKAREYVGLTQKEFAENFGLKWDKIKNIETEKHKLQPDFAESIEQNYSISGWWLLTGKGSMLLENTKGQASQVCAQLGNHIGQKEIELLESYRELEREKQEWYYYRIKADAIEQRLHAKTDKKDARSAG